jgi:ABC-type sugar transport system substrate-binding protein
LTKLIAGSGRRRRRAVTIGIASLSVGLLSACGTTATTASSSSSSSSSDGSTSSASLTSADLSALVTAAHEGTGTTSAICYGKKYTIGIDIYPTTITFGADVVTGAKQIATSTGCVTAIILDDNLNAETVIANVKSFIQEKVSGIALLNAVQAPEVEAIALAKAAHIPIVTASLGEPGTPFVDVNDGAAGLAEGTAVATAFKAQIGNKQPWIILANYPLLPPASDRVTGWLAGVAKVFPGIPSSHILQFNGQLNPAVTTQLAQPLLTKIPQGAPILTLGINDDSSFALAKLVHDSGHPMAGSGFGGDHGGQKDVCTGYYNTSGWFPERSMAYIYPALIAIANGATLPDDVYQKTAVLTKATINTYYPGACS